MTFTMTCARLETEKRPTETGMVHSIVPSQTILLYHSDGRSSETFITLQSTVQISAQYQQQQC